jgi:hypothetical protein
MLINKLRERVESLDLNLKGKVVLTEAATGPYVVTPVLAALAGAKVYAYAKNTRYGEVHEVFDNTKKVYENLEDDSLDINFICNVTPDIIAQADIITNSGHLRPLDAEKLQYAKDDVAIPLMYEAWEWRDADMDINYIRKRGFKIGATNERHPEVDVFNFLGDMAVKLIFDSGLCLYKNKFILICNNDFGPHIAKVVAKMCDGLGVIDKMENRHKYQFENVDWISEFPKIDIPDKYKDAEAVIFTAYPFDDVWMGSGNEAISIAKLKQRLNHPYVLRYAGDVDCKGLKAFDINYYPQHVASGHMGILPSAIGYDPIIRLQAGGLKAAEALITGNFKHRDIPILELV